MKTLAMLTIVPAAAVLTAVQPSDLASRLNAFVPAAMKELNVAPGLSIAVTRGDATIYRAGFGVSDVAARTPVRPDTTFYTASMVKAFTGITAAVLANERVVDLDAPLDRYFPGFTPPAGADPKKATLRGLLAHDAGFGNATINYVTTFVGPYAPSELVRVLNTYSQPQAAFAYSNANFALVGYAIEKKLGKPLSQVMSEKVLAPLGMRASTMLVSKAGRIAAKPYSAEREGFELIRLPKTDATMTGAGGIFMTATDAARFVRASLHGGRIDGRQALPEAAFRLQQTRQTSVDATFGYFVRTGYGLGLYLGSYDGEPLQHHFGSIAGYRSHMSWMPNRDAGVVVLENEGGDGSRFADLVAAYAYDVLLGKDADTRAKARIADYKQSIERAREQRDTWRADLKKLRASTAQPELPPAAYAGVYRSDRLGTLEVKASGGALMAVFGDGSGRVLPVGGHAFIVDWNAAAPGDHWTFLVTDGRVTGLDWGGRAFARLRER